MIINKVWSMPNSRTFKIPAIRDLIVKYSSMLEGNNIVILDPFANEASIKEHFKDNCRYISNDLDSQYDTTFHLEAKEFLSKFKDNTADMVLYDPVYSFRQLSECYRKLGLSVTAKDTSNATFAGFKNEIARITKNGAYVISCGWNSNGIGKNLGFEQVEILLVAHGSNHNDTIVTVEKKV